jgi:hypothetical protein
VLKPSGGGCPACGAPLYGWVQLPAPGRAPPGDTVLLERCESCGLGLAAGLGKAGAIAALLDAAREPPGGEIELRLADRASVQAALGGDRWAALEPGRRLYVTPESARPLCKAAGLRVEELRWPRRGSGQAWMWQTILNAFTFERNFARRARAGKLRPSGLSERLRFAVDSVVTLLAALPVALVSAPLELLAALASRGGELMILAKRFRPQQP